jgi:SH3 domain protein
VNAARTSATCALALIWAIAAGAQAPETVFVTRDFKAGLHEDKTVDSPISALVPAGTALQVVKREGGVSFVRAPDGTAGWIDNSYLSADPPADSSELQQARERIQELETALSNVRGQMADLETRLEAGPDTDDAFRYQALKKQNAELDQKLKAERLRAGDLQVQVAELRKRVGVDGQNAPLLEQLQQLEAENRRLQVALEGRPAAEQDSPESTARMPALRTLAIWLAIALITGLAGGIYLMDYLNRRRHGGFRV